MRFGSLFSGIGGIDLGLERAGMTCAWQSEIDPYASRVLAKHWPDVPNLGDVTSIDWSSVERPDLICGGYPCQPFSTAGARRGHDDPRHLWPYFADALRVLRPRYALMENVSGHVTLGLDAVLCDLASIGFDAEWTIIPASWVGAPHRRERIFILAHAAEQSSNGVSDHTRSRGEGIITSRNVPLFGDDHGDSIPRFGWWDVEPDVDRVVDGVPERVDRLKTLGNAVVPQVAEWVGRQILDANPRACLKVR
jgi:DNA (cytosine-5)-methyltransferase 1